MAIKIFGIITFLGGLVFFYLSGYKVLELDFIMHESFEYFDNTDLFVVVMFIFSFSAIVYVILVNLGYLKLLKKQNELKLAEMEEKILKIKTFIDKHENK